MKLILKYSLRNLVRIPIRSALYFATLFIATLAVCLCGKLYQSTITASENFANNYPFVATVTIRQHTMPDGQQIHSDNYLSFNHLEILLKSDEVVAYNIKMRAGSLAEDEIINMLPNDDLLNSPAISYIAPGRYIDVYAVANPYMLSDFFNGDKELMSGEWFSEEELRGGQRVILVSEAVADKYDFSSGDTIIHKCFSNPNSYAEYRITGIFESEANELVAYIPLSDYLRDVAIYRTDLAYLTDEKTLSMQAFRLDRIDFLLKDEDSGEKFIRDAKALGLDGSMFSIAINDKSYKTVERGLEAIERITITVLAIICTTAFAVIILLSVFYHIAKQKEKKILRALGMNRESVTAIVLCEILLLIIFSCGTGYCVGTAVSDDMIEYIDKNIIIGYNDAANADSSDPHAETLLAAPIRLSLVEKTIDEQMIPVLELGNDVDESLKARTELFYLNTDTAIKLLGVSSANIETFKNTASYGEQILDSNNRASGYRFKCWAPLGSEYQIGDTFSVITQSANGAVKLVESDGKWMYDSPTSEIYRQIALTIVGYYDGTDYPDDISFLMSLEELERLYQYSTVVTEDFRCNRYEDMEDICLK